ncbi:unnamed protein product [Rotaria socialis]|uniref:Rubisco LSMT substrate-binding domain-containing protein n=1 Tax=Rotaria socialis TaxID=392032 RepID=A0A817PN80_9BILA|nr:unnamed protein product [Rotaria socialis]CAF3487841.1 unnamed protein product [Rotaria socialis]CAF3530162.1 unnamed protein product [Rotaria socialis]CAF3718888.1 unnamed protein product [Rotaria socialis]CAF4139530.1 unnamed protein product [Rotaria socialis]
MKRRFDFTTNHEVDADEKQRFKPDTNLERLTVFKNWLNENNVVWENVDIRSSLLYTGFAVYSTSSQELPNIQIPTKLLMSNQSTQISTTFVLPTSDQLDQTDEHIDRETLILALFLLHECSKGVQSHWYPYIQLLPDTFTTTLFHKENYVENTSAFYLTETMRQSMTEVWNLVGSSTFQLEDFLWAYTTITSRSFKLAELGTALIPLADLANHVSFTDEANLYTTGINKETDRFVLKAKDKKIVDEEELCLRYNSDLANWQLLLYYGFAIDNNPSDSILLELKMDSNDTYEMEMKKMLLLNLSEDLSLDYELKIDENEPIISENLLATLRLIVLSIDELEQFNISNVNELLSSMVTVDNERRALNKLTTFLNDFKEVSFTTTLEENLNRLKSNQLKDDERYSLIYLIGQKQIVDNAVRWIDNAFSQLE